MTLLLTVGTLSVLFGLILLVYPSGLISLYKAADQIVVMLDEVLKRQRIVTGLLLLAIAGWIGYLSFALAEAAILHPIWVIALVFGLMYLLAPGWLKNLSQMLDQSVFNTNDYVMGRAKSFGLFFVIAGLYILVAIYITK
jgi:hypothetical protein